MDKKHMTTREKLELMRQIEERNEQRRKEYAAKKEREERLLDMYLEGEITKEELFKRIDE